MLDVTSKSNHLDPAVRDRFAEAYRLRERDPQSQLAKGLLAENCKAGCTASMVLLGDMYADGSEDEKKLSLNLFLSAAQLGDSSGMRNAGYCYAIGLNCERDKVKGAEWYRQAADTGNARAQCNLGVLYAFGHGVPQDSHEAFRWYLKSAENGCTRGMTNLGECYLLGNGTVPDRNEAERWFRQSGSPRAQYHLAEMFLDGLGGTPIDDREGMKFLRLAAGAKYSRALYRLGRMTEGEDSVSAVAMYLAAARKNNREAIARLNELGIPTQPTRS